MNKFLNKLICIILNFTVLITPSLTQASVVLNITKIIANAFGLGLALCANNGLNICKNIVDGRIGYINVVSAIFLYNLVIDISEIKSKISDSKEKDKLENKIEKLEMKDSILKPTKK